MNRRRILTFVSTFAVLATLLVVSQSHVFAQQAANGQQPAVKVTTTSVTRVILYKIAPGQRGAFDQDMAENMIPIYEAQKKAGILSGYTVFNNITQNNPDDWNVGVTLSYPNYAALDTLAEKAQPINLQHYGSAEKAAAAGQKRNQIRSVVSNHLQTDIHYSLGPS